MARIRSIKPEFFRHESLYEAEKASGLPLRLAFAGLWTAADREGRFRWQPRALKLDCLPYDECDFSRVLEALARSGFIRRYEIDGESFGFIPGWKNHQVINQREAQTKLPPPLEAGDAAARPTGVAGHEPNGVNIPDPLRQIVLARDKQCLRCKSADDLTVDHIFPRSIGGTHAITNLRTLCRSCNSGRPVAGQGLIDDLAKDSLTLDDMRRMCVHVHYNGEGKGREEEGKGAEARDALKARTGNFQQAIVQAFAGANSPNLPETSRAGLWLSQGYQEDICLAVIAEIVRKKPSITTLNYFDSAIREAHAAKAPPRQAVAMEAAEINWDRVLTDFKKFGRWSKWAGPDLESPACRAPADMLQKHGLAKIHDAPPIPIPKTMMGNA